MLGLAFLYKEWCWSSGVTVQKYLCMLHAFPFLFEKKILSQILLKQSK